MSVLKNNKNLKLLRLSHWKKFCCTIQVSPAALFCYISGSATCFYLVKGLSTNIGLSKRGAIFLLFFAALTNQFPTFFYLLFSLSYDTDFPSAKLLTDLQCHFYFRISAIGTMPWQISLFPAELNIVWNKSNPAGTPKEGLK